VLKKPQRLLGLILDEAMLVDFSAFSEKQVLRPQRRTQDDNRGRISDSAPSRIERSAGRVRR